jgi:monoterpene epsilon-lactone hydrolase
MTSKELQAIISVLKSQPAPGDLSVKELRATIEANATQFRLPQDAGCEPVDARGVPAEWVTTPESVEGRFIYYLHGGGYVAGSISTHREIAWRLSRAAKAKVLTIGYRLAPENPFPAAVEDATTGYRWLLSQGADAARVVIVGESAGGGLVMATLISLRDDGEPLPAAAIPVSPWVDLECLGESMVTKVNLDPLVRRDSLLKNARDYLGNTNPRAPLASPIYADLTGLPPLLIQVGTAEVLFDDATRLAGRAKSDGVAVVLEPWEDMIHSWHKFAARLPEAQQAIDHIGEFARKHTPGGS